MPRIFFYGMLSDQLNWLDNLANLRCVQFIILCWLYFITRASILRPLAGFVPPPDFLEWIFAFANNYSLFNQRELTIFMQTTNNTIITDLCNFFGPYLLP